MALTLSRSTITNYLPPLRAIHASLEIQVSRYPELDKRQSLHVIYLDKEFGSKLIHAMHIIERWLEGSNFQVKGYRFLKPDPGARWVDMLDIIKAGLSEHENDQAVIVLELSRAGRVSRQMSHQTLLHDFEGDGGKLEIVRLFATRDDFLETSTVQKHLGSRSPEATTKSIAAVNRILRAKLQLPQSQNVIEGKRGSGYRRNPLYNLVVTK